MYRGIVLGDFGGIQEGVWVQLWSGALGAVVSAVVAAVVAVFVLMRSSKHQRESAASEREMSALAEVLAAASRFTYLPYDATRSEVMEQVASFRAAVYRWALGGQELHFLWEMERASQVLSVGSLNAISARPDSSEQGLCISAVQRMVGSITEFGLERYRADFGRTRSARRLTATIDELTRMLESLGDHDLDPRSSA